MAYIPAKTYGEYLAKKKYQYKDKGCNIFDSDNDDYCERERRTSSKKKKNVKKHK